MLSLVPRRVQASNLRSARERLTHAEVRENGSQKGIERGAAIDLRHLRAEPHVAEHMLVGCIQQDDRSGTWLLATVSASLAEPGGASIATLLVAAWVPAILKLIAAVLPLLALRQLTSPVWNRRVRVLAWLEAGIMIAYGLTLTVVGLLVQADVIHASASADHRALAWHAYLWDPWFLIWGLLVAAALWRGRHRRSQQLAVPPS